MTTTTGMMRSWQAASSLAAPSSSMRFSMTTIGRLGQRRRHRLGSGRHHYRPRRREHRYRTRRHHSRRRRPGHPRRQGPTATRRRRPHQHRRDRSHPGRSGDLGSIGDRAGDRSPGNRRSISNAASRDVARQKIEARKATWAGAANLPTSRSAVSGGLGSGSRGLAQSRSTTQSTPAISRPKANQTPAVRAPSRSSAFQQPSRSRPPSVSGSRGRASAGRAGGGRGGGGRGGGGRGR